MIRTISYERSRLPFTCFISFSLSDSLALKAQVRSSLIKTNKTQGEAAIYEKRDFNFVVSKQSLNACEARSKTQGHTRRH